MDDQTPSPVGLDAAELTAVADQALFDAARAAGFAVLDAPVRVDADAARLLPEGSGYTAVGAAGGVLRVVANHVPTPAEFNDLSRLAGMLVTVAVAGRDVYAAIEMQTESREGEPPRSVGPALAEALARGASDVHLSVGSPPVIRVAGELEELKPWPPLSARDLDRAACWVAGDDVEGFTGDLDCAVTYGGGRWRVALYRQRQSLAMTLRSIPTVPPAAENLSLPAAVVGLAEETQGLILFVGPTGSGKTTTQAALIDRINRTRRCHIVTVEDPIEYVHPSKAAVVHQREVGDDTVDFATGLRHVLRQDPDVILVGEMRDTETMSTALTAAETGHLVFATVHATSTAGTFTRIIDSFPADAQDQVRTQLSQSLLAVVVQLLVPRADQPGTRQLVTEVAVMTPALRNIVREGRFHELASTMDAGGAVGMTTMDRSLAEHVAAGRISLDVGRRWAHDQASFDSHLTRFKGSRTRETFDDFDLGGIR